MPITTKDSLKNSFKTGSKPAQLDFENLIDTLVSVDQTDTFKPKSFQPTNSPIYLAQNSEVTLVHDSIANEQYQIQISQEVPGEPGQTNISIDFAQAAESSNYI